MRAASNSLIRFDAGSSPIGSVQKAGYEWQTPSEHCGRRLWASTTKIVLRDYRAYAADRSASLESAGVPHHGERPFTI
jgi:hypothetical protein